MDLLDELLDDEGARARDAIRRLLDPAGALIRDVSFNAFDVSADHERQLLSVWDVLDGKREPVSISFDEASRRIE